MTTRLIRNFDVDGNELPSASIEVSDEELQAEADDARLKEIAKMGHSAIPLPILAEAIVIMCRKLGFD